jgi:hypothetical protein
MAELIVGPVLRYVSGTEATAFVETDERCDVQILDRRARTFCVHGHHYALVRLDELDPGGTYPYQVALNGDRAWPPPDYEWPAPAIRTLPESGQIRLAFGSCRVSRPHAPPFTLTKDQDPRGREVDALHALADRMRREPPETWPHVMFFLGDQVYADEVSPQALEFIRSRRDTATGAREEVADFEEYCRLYWESWRDPAIRWFLSNVSASMIWDDHDVHDDWNTSRFWVERMRQQPWWERRFVGAVSSYWLYQHMGNLSPRHLDEDETYQEVEGVEDATAALERLALQTERTHEGTKWSYCRDLNGTRLIVMDSRAGRVLNPERRCMVDDHEWQWIVEHARGDYDHLLLGSTLPLLLAPAMHYLEAWNEAVCEGAWGDGLPARAGEWLREAMDFEHWAAFDDSFDRLTRLMQEVAAGHHGEPPASVVALSGDVHHAYLCDVAFRRSAQARSSVWQAVCSPLRNPLDAHEKHAIRAASSRPAELFAHALARAAGLEDPRIRWRVCAGPWFDNQVAMLTIDGRRLDLKLERARPGERGEERRLEAVLERRLA